MSTAKAKKRAKKRQVKQPVDGTGGLAWLPRGKLGVSRQKQVNYRASPAVARAIEAAAKVSGSSKNGIVNAAVLAFPLVASMLTRG
jgi:hypothetical protein